VFNIGGGEFLVIGLIALIVLGPSRLPDAARQVGKVMGDLRRVSAGFQDEIRTAFDDSTRSPDPAPSTLPAVQPLGGPTTPDEMASALAAVSSLAHPEPGPAPAKRKAAAKKAPANRSSAAKKKAPAQKTAPAKKAPAKKAAAKQAPAKQQAPAKRAPAKKQAPAKRRGS
jgi:Tat protein translocase TatB subunit